MDSNFSILLFLLSYSRAMSHSAFVFPSWQAVNFAVLEGVI